MPQRALITGVSGFAGGFLAEHLVEVGDAVLGSSPDGTWADGAGCDVKDRVEMVAWDLADRDGPDVSVRKSIEAFRPGIIYHLAAVTVPEDCGLEEPTAEAWGVNVEGTRRVLEMAESLPSRPRVVFVSSAYVYAPVPRESPRVDENAPLAPKGGYGRTKLAAEAEVRRLVASGGDAVVARAFQHSGPRQSPRMMLPQWARQFAAGGTSPVEVYTTDAVIDVSDVRDVVRAYRLLALRGSCGEVYNVGSGVARRSGDVLDGLRRLADPDRPIRELRPGFKQDPIADVARLAGATGWRATISIRSTVADTLDWWRRQAAPGDPHEERTP